MLSSCHCWLTSDQCCGFDLYFDSYNFVFGFCGQAGFKLMLAISKKHNQVLWIRDPALL
jgi:hypothetical protein